MNTDRRRIIYAAALALASAAACLAYAYFIEPQRLVVIQETIEIEAWDPAFDGIRIVMLGDIHGGSNHVTEEKLRTVVQTVNAQEPDLVVMLGDYVSETVEDEPVAKVGLKMPMETIAQNLAGMKASLGVFAVLGNHDGWYDDGVVTREFTKVGYRVLRHEAISVSRNGRPLRIFGMTDHLKLNKPWIQTSADARQVVEAAGEGNLVVLQHSPDMLPVISGDLSISKDLKLMLSAHTHGGQVWMPVFGRPVVPSNYGQKYARGHVKQNGVDLFVTSGIGTSVLPFRFLVPPEIVVLTVKAK